MASAVWVAFDRRFSGLTPRTGREICGLGKASGRGGRRFKGLPWSLGRMSSTTTGSDNDWERRYVKMDHNDIITESLWSIYYSDVLVLPEN